MCDYYTIRDYFLQWPLSQLCHCHSAHVTRSLKTNMGRLAPHVLDDRIVLLRMKLRIHEIVDRTPCPESNNQDSDPDQTAKA